LVLRANIDLDDSEAGETFMSLGIPSIIPSTATFFGEGEGHLTNIVVKSELVKPQVFTIEFIVSDSEIPQYVVRSEQFGFIANEVTSADTANYISGGNGRGQVGKTFKNSMIELKVVDDGLDFVAGDTFTFQVGYNAVANPVNVGNGTIEGLTVDQLLTSGEVFTVTMLSDTAFEVTGTNSGLSGVAGTVGVPFDNNKITFTLVDGSVDFVAGDTFTITATEVTVPNPLGETDAQRRVKIVTALQAAINANQDIRSPYFEFNLVSCPGYPEVADEIQRLLTDVNIDYEAFGINDVPVNKTPEQAAVWAMSTARVRSEYNAYYYPWCIVSNIDGTDVLVPPSAVAIRTIANSDNISYLWMAPAGEGNGDVVGVTKIGYVTGKIGENAKFVEVEINRGRMDILYEYDKNINPIQFIPGRGFKLMGQKTSASSASALDRISTVRLVCDMKRKLRKGSFPFLFKPNDQITRDALKANADGILADYMSKRALYDYATVCDSSNNTADRIDRNEMYLNVAIKPKKDAEFIYIPIRVVNTGTSI
jgi:phage tail sheath protein FI